ncbi:MAG TPA: dihydroorotate dehydrogenase-like protein [Opitutaceae bacterium]
MNLTTNYLGLQIANPIVPGASPYSHNLDMARLLEDAGAPALVMHSLFEEQVLASESVARTGGKVSRALPEDVSFYPSQDVFAFGPDRYLDQIRRLKEALNIPVIASLNASHPENWVRFSQLIQQAGADALELNIYRMPAWLDVSGADLERDLIEAVRQIKACLAIPVAVKLTPFYTSLPNIASQLSKLGVDGLVLFNQFYASELDIEEVSTQSRLRLTKGDELGLRLRWAAVLSGKITAQLIVSGGVQDYRGVVQALMSGAGAVQVVSSILRHGPKHLAKMIKDLREFCEEQDYENLDDIRGVLSLHGCPNPGAYERSEYIRTLQSWRS